MGMVLVATFSDEEEIDFDELMLFFKKKKHVVLVDTSLDSKSLKYDNIVIDSKY